MRILSVHLSHRINPGSCDQFYLKHILKNQQLFKKGTAATFLSQEVITHLSHLGSFAINSSTQMHRSLGF